MPTTPTAAPATAPPATPTPQRLLTIDDVAARLRIHRSTVYAIPFFRGRAVNILRRTCWLPEDVELFISLNPVGIGSRRAKGIR